MLPELFHFNLFGHEIHLYTYGLMMIVGFFAAVYLARFLANRSGLDGELFVNAGLIGLISGVIGARASHVLENLDEFTRSDRTAMENFLAMINLSSGGLTYYGGFLLAFIVLIWSGIRKKVPPALVQFHNGQKRLISPAEAQGNPELLALMKQQRSLPVHAAQIYSTITCFILAALLVAYFSMPHVAGRVFALMLMLEGLTRFLLEMLRVEPPVIGSFSLSMILGLMLVGLGAILWVTFGRFPRMVVPSAQPSTA